jgi:opacity protein-like surface antigen
MFTHSRWFADISYEWAGAMVNVGNLGMIGLSVTYLDYGDMEVTTLEEPDGTGQTFSAHDMAIALSYAKNLTDRFSMGGNVKYVGQTIKNTSASALAFDVGVLFLSDVYGLRIGASITNFGTDMQLSGKDLMVAHDVAPNIEGNNDQILADLRTDDFPLPLTFKVGLGMDVVKSEAHTVTVGVDALHPKDNAEYLNVGGEYVFNNMIALRAGYKSLFLDNTEEGLTLGFGIGYDFAPNLRLQLDYAYQDMDILEKTQHFSLGIKF